MEKPLLNRDFATVASIAAIMAFSAWVVGHSGAKGKSTLDTVVVPTEPTVEIRSATLLENTGVKTGTGESGTEKPAPKTEYDFVSDASLQKFVSSDVGFDNPRYVPQGLVALSGGTLSAKGGSELRSEAKEALEGLSKEFFELFGKKISVVSAYRSFEYQSNIARKNRDCVTNDYCAAPGQSEHQTGLAVDLFEATDEKTFLSKPHLRVYFEFFNANAHRFGFVNSYRKGVLIDGYHEEPWHWRYVGIELATELKASGQTLSERAEKIGR